MGTVLELNGTIRIVARITNIFTYHYFNDIDYRNQRLGIQCDNIRKVKYFDQKLGIPSFVTPEGFVVLLNWKDYSQIRRFEIPKKLEDNEKFDLCLAYRKHPSDDSFYFVSDSNGRKYKSLSDCFEYFGKRNEIASTYILGSDTFFISKLQRNSIEINELKINKDKHGLLSISASPTYHSSISFLIKNESDSIKEEKYSNIAYRAKKAIEAEMLTNNAILNLSSLRRIV